MRVAEFIVSFEYIQYIYIHETHETQRRIHFAHNGRHLGRTADEAAHSMQAHLLVVNTRTAKSSAYVLTAQTPALRDYLGRWLRRRFPANRVRQFAADDIADVAEASPGGQKANVGAQKADGAQCRQRKTVFPCGYAE